LLHFLTLLRACCDSCQNHGLLLTFHRTGKNTYGNL